VGGKFYTYILRCGDQSLYTGITNNLEKRLELHNRGKASRYTRARLPVQYVYLEYCENKSEALKREYSIKKLTKENKEKLVTDYQEKIEKGSELELDP